MSNFSGIFTQSQNTHTLYSSREFTISPSSPPSHRATSLLSQRTCTTATTTTPSLPRTLTAVGVGKAQRHISSPILKQRYVLLCVPRRHDRFPRRVRPRDRPTRRTGGCLPVACARSRDERIKGRPALTGCADLSRPQKQASIRSPLTLFRLQHARAHTETKGERFAGLTEHVRFHQLHRHHGDDFF